jgi:hypothetical protein
MIIQFEPDTSMQVNNYSIIAYSVHHLPMDNCSPTLDHSIVAILI